MTEILRACETALRQRTSKCVTPHSKIMKHAGLDRDHPSLSRSQACRLTKSGQARESRGEPSRSTAHNVAFYMFVRRCSVVRAMRLYIEHATYMHTQQRRRAGSLGRDSKSKGSETQPPRASCRHY